MSDDDHSLRVAIGLMRMALNLLQRMGEATGAGQLNQAIETICQRTSTTPWEEMEPELACLEAGIVLEKPGR